MRFLNSLIKTVHDIEGENSLLIHGLVGCNLDCFSCHNRKELIEKKHEDFISEYKLLEIISDNGYFFDNIIFSGGEILIEHEELKNIILEIKNIYYGNIIIYTNGTIPNGVESLIDLVDGFHMDLKYNIQDYDIFNICGVKTNISDIKKSLDIIYYKNKGLSKIRTVKYPQYDEEYLKKIKDFMLVNYPNIKYEQNEFYNV